MRIDLSNTQASQIASEASSQQVSHGSTPSGVSGAEAAVGGTEEDRTTLTSGSSSVGSLVSAAMNSPEVREDKVASLQQAIASGQYELDPEKIAASMIDEHA